MKDLIFLFIVLGLITFGMMAAQNSYRSEESEQSRQRQQRFAQPAPELSPSATPTPTGQQP